MIHAGIGVTHVNAFLTSVNIPPIDAKNMKRKEREIGPAIESLAKKSCTDALWEEREISNDELKLSYDMGWQKRGRGFNSQTGVGHMIGHKGGKVVGYKTRNKRCVTCHKAFRSGKRAKKHDCRRNWYQSSKAMEPDVAKEISLEIMTELDTGIHSIIGDEDSTTTKILREEVDSKIMKESDIIHVKRTLNNHLHAIKLTTKS